MKYSPLKNLILNFGTNTLGNDIKKIENIFAGFSRSKISTISLNLVRCGLRSGNLV